MSKTFPRRRAVVCFPALALGERVDPPLRGERFRRLVLPLRHASCSLPMNRTRKLLEMNECSKTGSWAQGAIKVRGDLSPRERAGVRGKVTLAVGTALALPRKSADRPKGRMALSHSFFHASGFAGGR